jgi:hypothetical protein
VVDAPSPAERARFREKTSSDCGSPSPSSGERELISGLNVQLDASCFSESCPSHHE